MVGFDSLLMKVPTVLASCSATGIGLFDQGLQRLKQLER